MSFAAIIRELMAAGVTGDALCDAVARIEQSMKPARASGAERQARYRERKKAQTEASPVTSRDACDASDVCDVTNVTDQPVSEDPSRARSLCEDNIIIKNNTPIGVLQKDQASPSNSRKPPPRRRTAIDPEWRPDETAFSYAESRGMPRSAVPGEFENFRNHHIARGTLSADWSANWRTWCGNFSKFSPIHARAGPSRSRNGFSDLLDELMDGGGNGERNSENQNGRGSGPSDAGDFGPGIEILEPDRTTGRSVGDRGQSRAVEG